MDKLRINRRNVLLILIAVVFISTLIIYMVRLLGPYYSPEIIRNWVMSFGKLSFLVFIFLQVLQVVVFFIPGEVVQAAGGYIYGTGFGLLLSVLGILTGSVITFIIARKFGNSLLIKILPHKEYVKIKALINKRRNRLIIFILYLLPGFPKDALGYVCGITSISLKWFITISTIARVPGILMSVFLGSNLYNQNYKVVIIASIVIFALFVIGMMRQDKILKRLE